jgi:hypothetical protein
MARISTVGIVPWYAHPKYRAADERELASNVYPDLAAPHEQAIGYWRRQAFSDDLEWVDHVLRNNVDLGEDEPPVQPRRQTTDAQKAYALWGREQEREAEAAAKQDVRQRWHDFYMESSIFERKRR